MRVAWILVAAIIISAVRAGFVDILCAKDPGKRAFFPCQNDCIENHGATGGKCGNVKAGDFNCYCEGFDPAMKENSMHCKEPTDDFRNVCTADCLCGHAALGGYCDFERKACVCTGVGKNVQNKNCPTENANDFFGKIVYGYLGPEGVGKRGMQVLQHVKDGTPLNIEE